jgi:hypothetical protein
LSGLSNEDIELSVDWTGEHGAFVSAMVDVGFLDGEENQLSIHDWAEHNPWAAGAKDRSEASRFAALCKRYGRNEAANRMPDYADRMRGACEPHTDRMRGGCEADAPSPSPSPIPLPLSKKVSQPDGVSIIVWRDFQQLRNRLKAPITETAMAGIRREAQKVGYSLEDALRTCVERSWRGFNSEWVNEKQATTSGGILAGAI